MRRSQLTEETPHEVERADLSIGHRLHALVTELFPICRSITGDGVRQSLRILQEHLPLSVHEVETGTRVGDWVIPPEWNIRAAHITDPSGRRIVDFQANNLHVVNYSIPVDREIPLSQLQAHLHSLEELPDAIPYVTSYYEPRWGFCISHRQRQGLSDGMYHVFIDSELSHGSLTYADCLIPGESGQEVLLSTYVCHPSMANNELSGPAVTTFLGKWLSSAPRRFSYRLVFVPETIGAVAYLAAHLQEVKERVIAGFVVTCVGDEGGYSYVPSRRGDTLADRVALAILGSKHPEYRRYTFLDRGSDERQYCSPGVDLPVASVMRSKYATYPEYHTSLDNLQFVTAGGLRGGYELVKDCLELIEQNRAWRTRCLGEPQLGPRGLWSTLGNRGPNGGVIRDFLAYADGKSDLIEISHRINTSPWTLYPIVEQLTQCGLLVDAGSDDL